MSSTGFASTIVTVPGVERTAAVVDPRDPTGVTVELGTPVRD